MPLNESRLQNIELISDFLLTFKLMQKTRTLYGLSSSKIFLKIIKQANRQAYDEFQTHYVNKICGPFTALEKIEDFQMAESAFDFNKTIEKLLKLNLKKEIGDYLPLGFGDIERNFEILVQVPEQDFEISAESSGVRMFMDLKSSERDSYLEPMSSMRAKGELKRIKKK